MKKLIVLLMCLVLVGCSGVTTDKRIVSISEANAVVKAAIESVNYDGKNVTVKYTFTNMGNFPVESEKVYMTINNRKLDRWTDDILDTRESEEREFSFAAERGETTVYFHAVGNMDWFTVKID